MLKLRVEYWHVGQLVWAVGTALVIAWAALSVLGQWGGLSELVGVPIEDTVIIGGSALVLIASTLFAWVVTWRWFGARREPPKK